MWNLTLHWNLKFQVSILALDILFFPLFAFLDRGLLCLAQVYGMVTWNIEMNEEESRET